MKTRGLFLICPVSLGCHHSKLDGNNAGALHQPHDEQSRRPSQTPASYYYDDKTNIPIVKESALGIEVVLQEDQSGREMDKMLNQANCDTGCVVEEEIQTACSSKLNAAPNQNRNSVVKEGRLKDVDPLSHLPLSLDRNYLDFPFFTDQTTIRHIVKGKAKIMFIMRGLPGSGKSSIVGTLKSTYNDVVVCSADDFFLNENGEYVFDVEKLGSAHGYCQSKAKSNCQKGVSVVIIDNTNVKRWELKIYLETAKLFGYTVILVEPKTDWKFNPDVLALRNTHGVPIDVLRKKVNAFDHVIPLYYGWFLSHKKSDLLRSLFSKVFAECLDTFPAFQQDLLFELGIGNLGRVSPDAAKEMLLGYYPEQGRTNPLLHCTSRFCGGGKAPGGKKYDSRKDVQSSCGRVFRLTLTGLVMTKKTCGVRVTLDEKCLTLFERPEEAEWVSRTTLSNNKASEPKAACSLSSSSLARSDDDVSEWKGVNKKGKKKEEVSSKRLKKRLAKEKKKTELENWFNSNDDLQQSSDLVDSKSKSSLSDLMNTRIAEMKLDDASGTDDVVKEAESFLTSSQIQKALDSNTRFSVSNLYPQLRNSGFARCAHITLKTGNNVASVETNLDVLHVCDLESSEKCNFGPADLISVTKGKAFYFGDGICCVYFDEPIKMEAVFSGYY